MNLTEKLIYTHLDDSQKEKFLSREIKQIDLKIDQTLTHDITAVMAYNAFEALEIDRVKTKSVSYIDHNVLCTDTRTSDDHLFLKTIANKYGLYYSTPGNGICHSVHISRFSKPGDTLLGADSHTATSGAVGMFAFGGGGVEVARAMAGLPIRLEVPKVINIKLSGKLKSGVNAKDLSLYLLKKFSVKGGVGKVFEYSGSGVLNLDISQRATITNMGAEMGATTSIFPTDERTLEFFKAQGREDEFKLLKADEDAHYDEVYEIDLSEIVPMVACPSQPDNVVEVKEIEGLEVSNIFIGSCTNASYSDIKKAAIILEGNKVSENVELTIGVSTRSIFMQLIEDNVVSTLLKSGARFTEIACGACDGIGGVPVSGGANTLRTTNRNFKGRSGTVDANIYLVSPEIAALSAISGKLNDKFSDDMLKELEKVKEPEEYIIDDSEILEPLPCDEAKKIEIIRGDNIKPLPLNVPIENNMDIKVSLKTKDNISTDDITPNDANFSAMRSNIPEISKYAFSRIYPDFVNRAKEFKTSIIVGGENYGQGSSREHAAIAPMYLGVKAVIAKSLARIHKKNLINHGVVPMTFENPNDYELIEVGDTLSWEDILSALEVGRLEIFIKNKNKKFNVKIELSDDEREIIRNGGLLTTIKKKVKGE